MIEDRTQPQSGRFKDILGLKFNRLTARRIHHFETSKGAYWEFICDCGNTKIARGSLVIRGGVKSCGCLHTEKSSLNGKLNKTHGMSNTKLYDVHRQMIRRCYDFSCKDFKMYGGRGISICDEWKNIIIFVNWANNSGYDDGLTIERKDNNGNYNPDNCVWVENKFQAKNTRRQYLVTFENKTRDLSDWSRITGIGIRTLIGRKNRGWDTKRMLTTAPFIGRNGSSC